MEISGQLFITESGKRYGLKTPYLTAVMPNQGVFADTPFAKMFPTYRSGHLPFLYIILSNIKPAKLDSIFEYQYVIQGIKGTLIFSSIARGSKIIFKVGKDILAEGVITAVIKEPTAKEVKAAMEERKIENANEKSELYHRFIENGGKYLSEKEIETLKVVRDSVNNKNSYDFDKESLKQLLNEGYIKIEGKLWKKYLITSKGFGILNWINYKDK